MLIPDQPRFRITGAHALVDGALRPAEIAVSGGSFAPPSDDMQDISARHCWILPGLIDLHGDGFERHLAPRRGVVKDQVAAFRSVEAELASCGITTAWFAQFWSWEGGMRAPEFAAQVATALDAMRREARLDLRLQLRLETHMFDDGAAVERFVATHGIDYLVFNDHLAHAYLAEGRKPPRLAGAAAKAGRAPEEYFALMQALHARNGEVDGFVAPLAARLAARGLRLGSHDDADGATRQRWGDMGLEIAEFPTSRDAVSVARARGEPVVVGAPNVVRGGSHNRKGMSARPLLSKGEADVIASDYHYPSMIGAAFALAADGMAFADAWALMSARPADIMGLLDRGRIADGLRADFVVLDPETRRVLGCFARGRPAMLASPFADQFLG